MLRKLLSTILFVALFAPLTLAQNTGSITGTVTNAETGDPVPTANVLLQEISRGTATNVDGEFEITNIAAGTYTLRVTFVGYQTYRAQVTIQAGQQLEQNVELQTGAIGLDELVVTGYGVESKRELTGSISKVSSEEFEDVPVQNTEGILQGRAAGVQVTTTSGSPGGGFNVTIRGDGSINAGSSPLWIVDGVQLSFQNQSEEVDETPLNSINPNNIESIEVLKDAAAAAIYGSQAANGVIIVTTKRGSQGPTQVSASIEQGVRNPIGFHDMTNRDEWVNYMIDAFENSFGQGAGEPVFRSILSNFGYDSDTPFNELRDYDWYDFNFREGYSQKYNLSASGGDDQTRFYIAGGYEKTDGHIKTSNFQRYNLRTNFDHQFNSRLSARLNLNLATTKFGGVCQDGPYINCPVSQSNFEPPISYPYLENGEYNPNTRFGLSYNPAVTFNESHRVTDNAIILGNLSATYNVTNWMSLTTMWGLDYRSVRDQDFRSPMVSPGVSGSINESVATTINFNTNTVLNMRQTFNEVHNVSGLLGGEYRRDFTREIDVSGTGLPNGLFKVLDATATPTFASGWNREYRNASYFGQAKYNYDERYFLNFTARYDGSSRFGSERRWGFFPSGSFAWRVSEENFFNADFVEDLKLRASYGVTGNSSIGFYAARGLYGTGGSYGGTTGLEPDQLANNRLTWEEAHEINLGLDFALWRSRVSGSIDVYQRDNQNLLLGRPLPTDSGYGSITENVGAVRNEGIEFQINTVNMDRSGFLWTSRFNVAVQRNEVLELVGDQQQLGTSVFVGKNLGVFYTPRWAGVNPSDGRPMWYDADGNITYIPSSPDDNVFFDGDEQDLIGGFGNRFSYKGLSLDVFFQYSFGQHAFPAQEWYFMQTPTFLTGVWDDVLRRWQQPGDITDIPKVYYGDQAPGAANWRTTTHTHAFFDASYIRLKNITLGYSLPTSLIEKLNLRGVRIYATGLNLATWTAWPGLDPEVAGSFTQASYPTGKQINGGIEIQF